MVKSGLLAGWVFLALACGGAPTRADPPPAAPQAGRGQGALAGRVLQADGTPLAGVTVRLHGTSRWGETWTLSTQSASDGAYRFEGLRPGDLLAFVAGDDWVARGLAEQLRAGAGPLARTLHAREQVGLDVVVERGVACHGRVIAADASLPAGARVEARPVAPAEHAGSWPIPAVTAPLGKEDTFALEGLVPGAAYELALLAPGVPRVDGPQLVASAGAEPLTLRLPALRAVEVRVTGEADDPVEVPGALCQVEQDREEGRSGGPGGEALADAHGRARVFAAAGVAATLEVRAAGWVRARVALGGADEVVEVRLQRPLAVSGRLLLPGGTPAAGIELALLAEHGEPVATAASAADGSFALAQVPPGRYMLLAGREEPDGSAVHAMQVVAAGATELVVRLVREPAPSGPRLRVSVVGPDGGVPGNVRLAVLTTHGVSITGGAVGGTKTFALDGDDARRGFAGAHLLAFAAEDPDGLPLPWGPAVLGPLEAARGAQELRLPPERVLRGRVHAADGSPLAGAKVVVHAAGRLVEDVRRLAGAGGYSAAWASVRTDADGRFAAHGLPEEDVQVRVLPPAGYVAPALTQAPRGTGSVEIVVAAGRSLVVTVLGVEGAPVAGVEVEVRPAEGGGAQDQATTDAQGRAALVSLAGDQVYDLRVTAPRGFLDERIERWKPAPTTIRLRAARKVAGQVSAPDGTPLARVFVEHDAAGIPSWDRSRVTGPDGRFEFDPVPDVALTLEATLEDAILGAGDGSGPVTRQRLRVAPGTQDAALVLDPGRTLEIVPPPGAGDGLVLFVRGERDGQRLQALRQVEAGRAWPVNGLTADDQLVVYMPADATGRAALAEVAAGQTTVWLERNVEGTLVGRVKLPEGGVDVEVRAVAVDHDITLPARVDATGRYVLAGVPDAWRWTLRATARVGERRYEAEAGPARKGAVPDLELRPVR